MGYENVLPVVYNYVIVRSYSMYINHQFSNFGSILLDLCLKV